MPLTRIDSRLHSWRWRMLVGLPLLALFTLLAELPQSAAWAQDVSQQGALLDPPARVAWLGLAEGTVSLAPTDADSTDKAGGWQPALLNRPLVAGDRLWTAAHARTELHAGSTAIRMDQETGLDFVAMDDNRIQLRLTQGTLQLRVRTLFDGQRLEIDTPNLAFVITQPGNYRLDVDPARDTSRVVAQSGGGWLYGDSGQSLSIDDDEQSSFTGTSLSPAAPGAALQDRFDQWTSERDQAEDQSVSARYVPRETVGYQQLDRYGDWQQDLVYGAVWLPYNLPENWAPYRTGLWRWIAPWGWTWIDEAPWGFAPFHYGRWAQIGPRWAWVPGRLPQRPVYAPALVAFIGDSDRDNTRPLGWFPLAPGEAFRPAYRSSSRYLNQLNPNMATTRPSGAGLAYRYQHQPSAVSALSRDDFARGRPVRGHLQPLSSSELNQAPVATDRRALLPLPVGRSRDESDNRRPLTPPERASERPNQPPREAHAPRAGRPEAAESTPRPAAAPTPMPVPPQAAAAPATLVNRRPPATGPALVPVPAPHSPAQSTGAASTPVTRRNPPQQPSQHEQAQRPPTDLSRQQDTQRRHSEETPVQRPLREPPHTTAPAQPQPAQRKPEGQERHKPESEPKPQREP